jgi:hypothetical protein
MNGHLEGIARNHIVGYTTVSTPEAWKESRRDEKLTLHGAIQENFAQGGSPVYRLGHDVTDGPWNNDTPGGHESPGWHWATNYKTGFNREVWLKQFWEANPNGPEPVFVPEPEKMPISDRFGAGVHRFYFAHSTGQQWPNEYDQFIGFSINVNYQHGIQFIGVPRSHSIYAGNFFVSQAFFNNLGFNVQDPNGNVLTPVQISGPRQGAILTPGNYLFQFKFTFTDAQGIERMNHYGFVLSVNQSNAVRIVRTQGDVLHWINNSAATTIERHSIELSNLQEPFFITNQLLYSAYNDEIGTVHQTLPPSDGPVVQEGSVAYDNISYYLEEAGLLGADLAIVLNIGSGSPEEAVGLIEYLKEMGHTIAYVELGSELVGN